MSAHPQCSHDNSHAPTGCKPVVIRPPLVSVVIPTRNRAPMVANAIRSAMAQTVSPIEIIVVDDCSADDTAAVVGLLNDRRVRYVRRSSCGGGSAARNTGIGIANGEFIAFLDDDDEWLPEKLARQLAAISGNIAVLCNVRLKSNGAVLRRHRRAFIRPAHLRRGFVFGGGMSTFLVRADAMKRNLLDEKLTSYQDWDLLLRLTMRYPVGYLDEPLVQFNDGDHGRISNRAAVDSSPGVIEERLRPVLKHREFLGSFWFRYHSAKLLLAHLRRRHDRLAHLCYTLRQCGLPATFLAWYHRLEFELRRAAARRQ